MKNTPMPVRALTMDARQALLNDLVAARPHAQELLVPDDHFYGAGNAKIRLTHMKSVLCRHLAIKPGYISVSLPDSTSRDTEATRLHLDIADKVANEPLVLGAALAYEFVRFLLEIPLQSTDEELVIEATVALGLGLIVLNGLEAEGAEDLPFSISTKNYGIILRRYMGRKRIEPTRFMRALTPWAAKGLDLKISKNSYAFAAHAKHQERLKRAHILALIWIGMVVTGVGLFAVINQDKRGEAAFKYQQQQVHDAQAALEACVQTLAISEDYQNNRDIQVQRYINAEQLRCKSLENTYELEQRELERL